MTDSEKELRDLAKAATPGEWRAETDGGMNPLMPWRIARPLEPRHETTARRPYHALYSTDADARFAVAANPAVVLALLDRIEALEKQVGEAERKGAEEMRESLAAFVEDVSVPLPIENWRGTKRELTAHFARALAERIRKRPIPGDAP